ncbi:GNAT family N-acetyltransferase [Bordetella genomosp. 5]|uniref:GNAT family N-acetyltransferase n=1 Tax=Bordetella genomosp. 5 TaxID=1395608 RepID=UPI000B9E3634|nr:GNAT family N-acetyltransferase [Bordetella genomosp. 5]OZI43697.1 GNAT family N-acetyltransferase [Bordetella genomosp. 5]
MTEGPISIPLGYTDVPRGHIASIVTDLEMRTPPPAGDTALPAGYRLAPVEQLGIDAYRALFRKVGADWLWFSRLFMSDAELAGILAHPDVQIHIVRAADEDVGILELDFRQAGECELMFLGLTPSCTGLGLGRALMQRAIALAWARPIERMWVHTCTYDHPSALRFYTKAGFTPYATRIELQVDPRLTGHLPRHAAAHVPIIE